MSQVEQFRKWILAWSTSHRIQGVVQDAKVQLGTASIVFTINLKGPACLSEIISPTCLTACGCNGGAPGTNLPRKLGSKAATGSTV